MEEALKTIADSNHMNAKARENIILSSKQLIELFGVNHISNLNWFRDDDKFISKFLYPTEPSIYIEQNIKENCITFSNNIKYIELFNEIFEEYKKKSKDETDK